MATATADKKLYARRRRRNGLMMSLAYAATLFGVPFALSGVMTVALSLVPYSAAYIADSGVDALRQLRAGSLPGALLFLPNITRAFFVLVMSSSAGAAIGICRIRLPCALLSSPAWRRGMVSTKSLSATMRNAAA